MSQIVVVDGPAQILIGNGLAALGYTANGVEIIEDVFMGDVPSDLQGGDLGPPTDIQYFGQIDRVRAELTVYDPAVAALFQPRMNGASEGQITNPGTLIAAAGYGFRLLILPTLRPRNYLFAVPRAPINRNKGTRFSRLVVEFECHSVNGVLYNGATS